MRSFGDYLLRCRQYGAQVFHTGLIARQPRRIEILTQMFHEVNAFLHQLDIEYWLECGTLLGWYRSCTLIPHDKDLDFGMLESDFAKIWAQRGLLPAGFQMYDTSKHHHGAKLYISYRGYDADLYFYRTSGQSVQCLVKEQNPRYMLSRPLWWFLPTQAAEFLNRPTRIPARPEDLLHDLYGYLGEKAHFNKATHLWEPGNE